MPVRRSLPADYVDTVVRLKMYWYGDGVDSTAKKRIAYCLRDGDLTVVGLPSVFLVFGSQATSSGNNRFIDQVVGFESQNGAEDVIPYFRAFRKTLEARSQVGGQPLSNNDVDLRLKTMVQAYSAPSPKPPRSQVRHVLDKSFVGKALTASAASSVTA